MTSKFSLGMLERIEAEESADVRRLRRLPVTVPKMRVIILSRPFLFLGIEKAELRKKLRPACQISPIAMQQWGFKHEKSKERKKGCHLWMASFLRFIAANLSLTHAVTAVSPR